jgi:SAM-dependent methyltransferase
VIFTDFYSEVYDQIHLNKNYEYETLQIAGIIANLQISKSSSILDFGCGTGKHLLGLNTIGYKVSGYDINANMLQKAKFRNKASIFYSNYSEIPKAYTFCYSLFDVLSYQISEDSIDNFLTQVCGTILEPGWILLDGWHLPGLLQSPPTSRTRTFQYLSENFTREVLVSTNNNFKVTELCINIFNSENNSLKLQETHFLRAFEPQEIVSKIRSFGGSDIIFFDGENYLKNLDETSWRFAVLFKLSN